MGIAGSCRSSPVQLLNKRRGKWEGEGATEVTYFRFELLGRGKKVVKELDSFCTTQVSERSSKCLPTPKW